MSPLFVLFLACTSAPAEQPDTAPEVAEAPDPETPTAEQPAPEEPIVPCTGLDADDSWMNAFIARHADALGPVAADPKAHRLQLVVGEVRNSGDDRCVDWHPYRLQQEYFYPASALKHMGAVAALQTVRRQMAANPELASLTYDTPIEVERLRSASGRTIADGRVTTLRTEIDKALTDSDNPAFNFTYDIAGQAGIHRSMTEGGLTDVHLVHRLSIAGLSGTDQLRAPRMVAQLGTEEAPKPVELVPERTDEAIVPKHDLPDIGVGTHHRKVGQREVVKGPFEMVGRNAVSLYSMARLSAWIADPRLAPDLDFADVTAADRELIASAMARVVIDWPRAEPFRGGIMEHVPGKHLFYMKKSGSAYGFHLSQGYVQDQRTGRAFLFAATTYVNPNGIVNDGRYGYEQLSAPFYTALADALTGELIAQEAP